MPAAVERLRLRTSGFEDRDADGLLGMGGQKVGRQAAGFAAEDQEIAGAEFGGDVAARGVFGGQPEAGRRGRRRRGRDMDGQVRTSMTGQ